MNIEDMFIVLAPGDSITTRDQHDLHKAAADTQKVMNKFISGLLSGEEKFRNLNLDLGFEDLASLMAMSTFISSLVRGEDKTRRPSLDLGFADLASLIERSNVIREQVERIRTQPDLDRFYLEMDSSVSMKSLTRATRLLLIAKDSQPIAAPMNEDTGEEVSWQKTRIPDICWRQERKGNLLILNYALVGRLFIPEDIRESHFPRALHLPTPSAQERT